MTTFEALVIGAAQGLTELAPVSSLGHGVILPALLGWQSIEKDPSFLPFMVALHLGTTLALLLYFHREWRDLLGALVSKGPNRIRTEAVGARHVFWLLVVGTVPAGLVGLGLEKKIRHLFSTPVLASIFLVLNGGVLILAEWLRRRSRDARTIEIANLGFKRGFLIGIFQAVALLPGISRSGITMVGGLVSGLSHEESAKFSFLLSTPIIGAAGVLEIPKLLKHGSPESLKHVFAGGAMAFAVAWLTTFLLMRYFRRFEANRALAPFGIYCLLVGGAALTFLR